MSIKEPRMPLLVRFLSLICALALGLALAGCGDKEATQRAAFVTFLQTRVLDRPGVRVPQPTEEQKKSFGPYASHYAVITEFNEGMNQSVSKPMNEIMSRGALRSIADVVARRDDLKVAREGIVTLRKALDTQLAKADAARGQLKQPPDLKTVFDQAYERTVTQPAATFTEVFPALDAVFEGAIKVADYIAQNKSKISVNGAQVTVMDPAVQKELNAMLQQLNAHSAAIATAQRKLQAMVRGS
jgi:hypothetical protein